MDLKKLKVFFENGMTQHKVTCKYKDKDMYVPLVNIALITRGTFAEIT